MSTNQNTLIMEDIIDEINKIHFVRESDKIEYGDKWYQAVIDSEQPNIFKVQPPLFYPKAMTDDELIRAENSFINSFSE